MTLIYSATHWVAHDPLAGIGGLRGGVVAVSRLGLGPTAQRHGLDNDHTTVEHNLRPSAGGIRGASSPCSSDGPFHHSGTFADLVVFLANDHAGNIA
jgi:hypothetical protein